MLPELELEELSSGLCNWNLEKKEFFDLFGDAFKLFENIESLTFSLQSLQRPRWLTYLLLRQSMQEGITPAILVRLGIELFCERILSKI